MHRFMTILVAAALLLAACGDSGGTDEAAPAETPADATEAAETTAAPETAAPETAAPETAAPETEAPSSDDASDFGVFADEDCLFLVEALQAAPLAALGDPESASLEDTARLMEEVARAAPDEIKQDMQTLAEAFAAFAEAAAEAGVDFANPATFTPEAIEELESAAAATFDSPEVQDAGDRVSTFFDEKCAG